MQRRKYLAALGGAVMVAGCTEDGGSDEEDRDEAEPADDQGNAGNGDGTEPEGTAEKKGEEERNAIGYPSEYIEVRDVEFKNPEEQYGNPYIEGVVDNVYGEELSYVEVSAQVFNDNDEQIADALANTSDMRAEKSWRFEMGFFDLDSKEEAAYWMGKSEVSDY